MAGPWEKYKTTEGPWKQYATTSPAEKQEQGSSLAANFGGLAAGLGDLATGLIKMPAGIGAAIGGKISDPSTDINIHRQASQAMMDDAMPSMGQAFGVADNPTYKMMMKPFELLGEGIDYLGNKAGKATGSSDVAGATKLGLDIATLGVGIPGAKLAGKGLAKVAEAVDPGLRNIKAPTSSKAAEILAKQRELENSKQIDVPEGLVKQTPMERMATELGAPEVPAPTVMNSMARDLTSVVTPEVRAAEIAREQSLRDVQRELDLRQVEMERAVLTQRTLERNATLRQQQEAASAVSDSYKQYLATQEKARQLAEEAQVNANSERMSRATQLEIDDTPHNGNADIPRTGNVSGTVPRDAFTRVDENGMPIRADLSMDVQKSESPLQRDFWVEQNENFAKMQDQSLIDPTTGQWKPAEQVKSIEQALDSMPDLPWRSERDVAIDLLKGELPLETSTPKMAGFNTRTRKQGGGLLIDPKEQGKKKAAELAGVKLESSIPKDPNISEAIQAALSEGKDSKGINALQSGSTSTAYKRASAAIHAYSQVAQNALKRADLSVRENVFPFENAIKRLSKEELVTSFELAKDELFSGRPLDGELLASSGLSPKQLEAIAVGRKMMEDSLRIQNEVRAAKGKSPITAREAYYSSRWQGDFRQAIKNADGEVVYVLAADSRIGLDRQVEALKKEMPDLVMGESYTVKSSKGKTDLESAYTAMLDILDVRNEADSALISRIEELKEQAVDAQTRTTLGQEKHFKRKTGVRGFVGDRPGVEPTKEAVAFFEQQVQYAKNAYQWAELQRASDSVKELVSNAELQAQQPNNVRYIRDHWKNTLGFGESKAIAAIEDAFRESFGISPNMVSRGVGGMKSYFILSKLAVSAGNTVTSLLQTTNVAPNMAMLWGRGYKGNPVSSIALGMAAGPVMALGHLAKHKFGVDYTSLMTSLGDKAPFWQEAFKYAEDNGVIARSVIDESPIGTAFSKVGTAGKVLGTTISAPEALTRSIAFSTFAEMLRDSGKFKDNSKLFQMAEEMTNLSMYDYRANEHAMVFSKMGNLGKAVDVLQTYPMSWYNQWVSVAKEAGRGNVAPFVVFTALQGTMAGLMGAPYVEDMYKGFMHLKDFLPAKTWAKMEESDFLSDPKLWTLKYFGASPVYGAMSDKTGIGLTSRLAAPGIGAMAQAPGAPLIDIAKQGIAVGKAAMDPTNTTKLAQAAMQVAPVGLQGLLETSKTMEGHTYNPTPSGNLYMGNSDLADRKGQVVRTPEEENLRKWGFRSQREVFERDVAYNTNKATKVAAEKSRTLPDAFYDAIRRGDVDSAKELNTTYVKLTGKAIGNEQLENQVREEFLTTIQNAKTAAKSLQALKNLKRMDELLKEVNQGK